MSRETNSDSAFGIDTLHIIYNYGILPRVDENPYSTRLRARQIT
jgi:hypothetical protein